MSDSSSFEIHFEGDKPVTVCRGQSILQASLAAGIPHFHACGGNAECSTCRVLVLDGMENLSAANASEKALSESVGLPANMRLACQAKVLGSPVRVRRIILDETDLPVYIREEISNDAKQLGQKKELVLFFLDIRNFTPFVESYLPFDAVHVMRAVHTIFNLVIGKYNGVIVDTAGDGFYAVFGLETNLQQASGDAIKAGYAIHKELKRFNETYLQPYFGTEFEIGIGVNCGEVIVGEVLVGQKSHLSVMGLAVNIAARIQETTKRLGNSFIVSADVMKNSGLAIKGKKRTIRLKGLQEVLKVHMIGDLLKSSALQSLV